MLERDAEVAKVRAALRKRAGRTEKVLIITIDGVRELRRAYQGNLKAAVWVEGRAFCTRDISCAI